MNFKTLSLVVAVVLGGALFANAAPPARVDVPMNQKGVEAHPDNAGYLAMRNSGTSEMVVCSGRCLLKAIIMSTGPTATYLRVRNTALAGGGNNYLILNKYVRFAPSNTAGLVNNPLPAPIILDKGISVELSSVSADEDVTVLYRDLD